MKSRLLFLIIVFLVGEKNSFAQSTVVAIPKSNYISVTKIKDMELNIPLEIDFINTTGIDQTKMISLQIDNTQGDVIKQMDNNKELSKLKIINNDQSLDLKKNESKKTLSGFYLTIYKDLTIYSDKTIYLKIMSGGETLNIIQINIQPSNIFMEDYKNKSLNIMLDEVTKVESSNNILTVYGYKTFDKEQSAFLKRNIELKKDKKQSAFLKRNIELRKGEVLGIWDHCYFWYWKKQWSSLPISLTTIPFKIRPKLEVGGKSFSSVASSGITNIGFNLDIVRFQLDRYFSTGKKSTHKFILGYWAGPSVEELDATSTNNYLGASIKSKQLFASTAITLTYSYNDISFSFVPAGWDFSTSTIGNNWIYKDRRWWGFGIGVNPKIFATILNK